MKPFFKPEDFYTPGELDTMRSPMQCAAIANAKLRREGKVVFSQFSDRRYWEDPNDPTTQDAGERSDLQATLINIERIEKSRPADIGDKFIIQGKEFTIAYRCFDKKEILLRENEPCTHSNDKVHDSYGDKGFEGYICECGAKVKPTSFKEIT